MPAGPNVSSSRGFNVTTNPERFTNFPNKRYKKSMNPELLIFENESNLSSETIKYSNPIIVNLTEGFCVHVNPESTGEVYIETAINPEANFWNPVATIYHGGYYSNIEKLSFIRIGLAPNIESTTVWLYRQYLEH